MKVTNILNGNEKFVVASGKGGVGKTTAAVQLLAPFLYHHNGGKKVKYIEVDDVNESTEFFTESNIISSEKISVKNEEDLSLAMTDLGNAVIDLGGNSASYEIIGAIGESRDFQDIYWVIPLGTGKDDAKKALSTFMKIQDIYKNYSEKPKITFILNGGVDEEDLELDFAYFFGSDWMDLDFVLKDELPTESFKYIPLRRVGKIILSTALKKLCVEIADPKFIDSVYAQKDDVLARFKEASLACEKNPNDEKAKKVLVGINKERRKNTTISKNASKIQKYVESAIYTQYPFLKKIFL